MHRFVANSASLLALSLVAAFAGCSSSNGGGGGNADSGSGGTDGAVHKDAGGSSSGGDSGGSSSGGDSGDDGGATCPDNTAFTPQPTATATAHRGACSATDLAAFLAACGDNGGLTSCNDWQTANVAGPDGGGGNACGNCILDPTNKGAAWSDQVGFFFPNYGACLQLTDPTNGPACGAAVENHQDCDDWQCGDCTDTATQATCNTSVDGAICKQYASAVATACAKDAPDSGAYATCFPGSATNPPTQDPDWTYIITLICGGGDAGVSDAGGGG
jgi:hypothetical protein